MGDRFSSSIHTSIFWILFALSLCAGLPESEAAPSIVVGWGLNIGGQTNVPSGLSNVISVAAGNNHSFALKADGTVLGWGNNGQGQLNVPAGLTNVTGIAAGANHTLAVTGDGRVVAWGANNSGAYMSNQSLPPNGLTNIVAVGAGINHSFAIRKDGTIQGWGYNIEGEINIPAGVNNAIAAAGGDYHSLALTSAGQVFGWGDDSHDQARVPAGLSNVVAIAAGWYHSLALKSDGTVVAWGYNFYGQTNVPVGLSNIIAISAGLGHSMALSSDGHIYGWGNNYESEAIIPTALQHAVGIAAGEYHNLGIAFDGSPVVVRQPVSTSIFDGTRIIISAGVSGNQPINYQWSFNQTPIPGATNSVFILTNVQTADAGNYRLSVNNTMGSATSSNMVLAVVQSPPVVITQPSNQLMAAETNFQFTPLVTGSVPMAFQWRFNGADIAGATNAYLTLTTLQLTNEGNYQLVVTNAYGTVTSSNAYLNVVDYAEAINAPNLSLTSGGDAKWFVETNETHDGFVAVQAADVDFDQQSTLETSVQGPATATFWWKTSFYPEDYLNCSIDAVEQARISGDLGWLPQTVYLGTGPHTLKWSYVKPSYASHLQAKGWFDELSVIAGGTSPTNLFGPTNQLIAAGLNTTLTVSAKGTPPLLYQWQMNGANLLGATNASLTISNLQLLHEGNYRAVVTNNFGMVTTTNAFLNVVDVPEALNTTNLVWTMGGNLPWTVQNATTHDGIVALQTGAIGQNQESSIQTVVNGPGTMEFWWKVSSQPIQGYLNFSVDGVEQGGISGNVDWQRAVFSIGTGSHILQWKYRRNGFGSGGLDSGWLDEVFYTPGATAPIITVGPTNQVPVLGSNALFTVAALGTPPLSYQWQKNGTNIAGATTTVFAVTNCGFADRGLYQVAITNQYGYLTGPSALLSISQVFAWGAGTTNTTSNPTNGQSTVHFGLINVKSVSAGGYNSGVINQDGHALIWGNNNWSQTNVPAGASNLLSMASGAFYTLARTTNGNVLYWGYNGFGVNTVPATATNVSAISAGEYHNLALRSNGTLIAWGAGTTYGSAPHFGQSIVPPNLSNLVAIVAGGYHSLAITSNGMVLAWGLNTSGQTNVPVSLTNAIAVAAGASNSLALRADGTLSAWGDNSSGQTNIPVGLSNVVAIACGGNHCLALRQDGTLAAWGSNNYGQTNLPPGVTNVTAIAAGVFHNLVLINDGSPSVFKQPDSQVAYISSNVTMRVTATGAGLLGYQWRLNGTNIDGATNSTLSLINVQLTNTAIYTVVITNSIGSVLSSNATLLVTNVPPVLDLGLALNATNLVWTTSGNVLWTPEQVDTHDGVAAATSGPLTWPQQATLQTTVTGPGTLTFWWKASGVIGINYFSFTVDSISQASLSPTAGWQQRTQYVASGSHTLRWIFNKSDTACCATFAGWVDQVSLDPGATPPFVTRTIADQAAAAGTNIAFSASVNGTPPLAYQWQFNGVDIAGGTRSSLSRLNVQESAAGVYTLVVTNIAGMTNVAAFLTVNPASPSILLQPVDIKGVLNTNYTFSVSARGSEPLTYDWLFNGIHLSPGTNFSVTLTNVQPADAGSYQVVVTNSYGAVTSSIARLYITNSPFSLGSNPADIQYTQSKLFLSLNGLTGQGSIIIEASTNLSIWEPLFTNAPAFGQATIIDPGASNYIRRYYRARVLSGP